jgi:hypothetical protein
MTDRDPALADQPPEVTVLEPGHHGSLPPATPSAERINEFLRWFGDGLIFGAEAGDLHDDGTAPPLYARDLAALAQLAAVVAILDEMRESATGASLYYAEKLAQALGEPAVITADVVSSGRLSS